MLVSALTLGLLVTMARCLELYQMSHQTPGQCGGNETYNSVSLACEACGPGTRVTGGECECLQGWVVTRSGAALECQQCPDGQEATSGRYHYS